MKRALICGINGQDGAYLARHLLTKGYSVIGTSRDSMASSFNNLQSLGIKEQVETVSMALNDFRSVYSTILRHKPDEIYNLAGQTSVGLSFEQPVETMESIVTGTLNLLESLRFIDFTTRFYNAGSSECFGNTGETAATESTPFYPRSPYAVAKAAAHGLVANYREAYGLFACTGILFNHESPLRPERFVTQKIVRGAAQIASGNCKKLSLGDLDIERDWGWAPEYVEAMWLMIEATKPEDYIIATGKTVSLAYFVESVFSYFGLDWTDHVIQDKKLSRPLDIRTSKGNAGKAEKELGWKYQSDVDAVVNFMCKDTELKVPM
ncbi:GDP-mannose 4,6-dehydratase [Methylomonas albis]|uniref:GDP-mannose 4,6-dehydratase n=1 Tax=Methylomonas albis TaxID=1854563 RepID=A0ABR9D1F5_9GAMM|nr:GDP-mannose 4,6-dehydratase [Methylomonas albis]MBD9356063.1 GDP-mannose 4,6-dehydratase [Methylomonas albis]